MEDRSQPIRNCKKLVRLPRIEDDDLFASNCIQRPRRASFSEFRCKNPGHDVIELNNEQSNRLPPILENCDKNLDLKPRRASENASSVSRARFYHQISMANKKSHQLPNFVFDPDGCTVFYWTCLTSLAVLYNYWIIILRVAFQDVSQQEIVGYIDAVCDFIYLSDIAFQLRTGYLMDGIPIFDVAKLRQHYMSQNVFIRDVMAIMPLYTLSTIFSGFNVFPIFAVYFKIDMTRFNRLLKLHTLYKFYDLADSRTSNPNCLRAFRLSLTLVIVIHWIGCLYYIISEYEGLGINNWVYTNLPDKQRFWRKYIVCMYWSAMTLTTIGESNPPETDIEYIFTGLTFLIGVFIFATVVGNVGDVIANINATRQEFQAKMDQIKIYLTHKKVPPSLQIKVKKWAEYSWSRTQATDESRLLHMLPERLRAEIAVHVHLDTLRKVKIFEQCEHGFLCELVLKLKSQIYSPGDYICKAGETGREMYIINHGKVEVVVANTSSGEEVVVALLSEGNYFGEISLLRIEGVQNRRTADVRSVGYSELLCLSRKDLMAALVEYPEAKTILELQARERIKTNMQAKRTFSVDAFLESSEETEKFNGRMYRDDKKKEIVELRAVLDELKQFQVMVTGQRLNELNEKISSKEKEVKEAQQLITRLKWNIRHLKSRKPSVTSHKWVYRRSDVIRRPRRGIKPLKMCQLTSSEERSDPIEEKKIIALCKEENENMYETIGSEDCFEDADVMDENINKLPKIIVVDDNVLADYDDSCDPLRLCMVEKCRRRCSSITSLSETSNSRRSSYQSSCTNSDPEELN
ncbi:cyclic nucleotide-gated channel alpha-3-like isoform X1 [Centruroides vittatus]|uniref:cyclic nucleotide-gated channel alpha-3-like isoform X1 n=2 Tax=Centruroides vittatus TaxID=120091 RepID=UPI00350EC927